MSSRQPNLHGHPSFTRRCLKSSNPTSRTAMPQTRVDQLSLTAGPVPVGTRLCCSGSERRRISAGSQAWRRGDTHAAAAASRRAIRAWREATGTVEQRCILGDAVCGEKRILKHSLEKRITAPPSAPSAPQRSWEEDRRKRRGVERLCNPLGAPLRRGGVVRG